MVQYLASHLKLWHEVRGVFVGLTIDEYTVAINVHIPQQNIINVIEFNRESDLGSIVESELSQQELGVKIGIIRTIYPEREVIIRILE